ncbi:MFS transporter [Metarhizium robertsii]|uniref:MFS transporter n=1 Tax=Metarhizium robertsii TaxID=568076 RepID=A0A0A1V1D1_9HYPO|nr:MFS transporter [Metarhizium robertsii]
MDETTPLLPGEDGGDGGGGGSQQRGPRCASFFQARRPRTIYFLLSLMVFGLSFSGSLGDVPVTRLIEDNLCQRYYAARLDGATRHNKIDESLCKSDEIQSQLAYLNGLLPMIEAVVGLFVALPYGLKSGINGVFRKGRKPVLWLSLAGIFVSGLWIAVVLALGQRISIYIILISPVFAVVGGGSTVLVSAIYSVVADVVCEADRVSAFLTVSLGSLVGNLFGPLTASSLMRTSSPWTPIALSLLILLLAMGVIGFIPETLPALKQEEEWSVSRDDSLYGTVNSYVWEFKDQIKEAIGMIRQPSLSLILFAFLCPSPVGIATSALFIQYVSKRFDWSMAAAGYLLSVRSMVNVFVVLLVIPGLSKLLVSGVVVKGFSAGEKDRILAQASAFSLAAGFLLLAGTTMPIVISGLIIKTLGAGLPSLCRSLAAYHTSAENTSKLQTVIGITETMGLLVAAPGLAWMFSIGMKLGGVWMGLPCPPSPVAAMTTAHRPTFDPARGKEALRGPAYHQRLQPAHTQLKFRKAGQGGDADDEPSRDLAAELLAAEAVHFSKKKGAPVPGDEDDDQENVSVAAEKRPLPPAGDGEEDYEAKRRRILEETRDIDADDSSEEDDEDSDDESEDDEDAELQRELERVRREREEKKKREKEQKRKRKRARETLHWGTRFSISRITR